MPEDKTQQQSVTPPSTEPQTIQIQAQAPSDGIADNLRTALAQEREKRKALAAEKEALAAKVAEYEGVVGTIENRFRQRLALTEMGFKSDSVRRFLQREYQDFVSDLPQGTEAPSIQAWLEAVKDDPLYAPHFERVQKQSAPDDGLVSKLKELAQAGDLEAIQDLLAPKSKTQEKTNGQGEADSTLAALKALLAGGNLNQEAGGPPSSQSQNWGSKEIDRIRRKNRGTLGSQKQSVLDSLRRQGLIK